MCQVYEVYADLGGVLAEDPGDEVDVVDGAVVEDPPADLEVVQGREWRVARSRLKTLHWSQVWVGSTG